MKKYCPPGVLCIENTTMFFLLFIIVLGGFVLSSVIKKINLNTRIFANPNHMMNVVMV